MTLAVQVSMDWFMMCLVFCLVEASNVHNSHC